MREKIEGGFMRTELDIQTLQQAKANAVQFYSQGGESQEFWEQVIDDCDEEIKEISKEREQDDRIIEALIVKFALVFITLLILYTVAGCQTFDGLKADIHWLTADVEHTTTNK